MTAASAPAGVGSGSSSAYWKHKTSPLPLPEMVHTTGPINVHTTGVAGKLDRSTPNVNVSRARQLTGEETHR